MKFLAVLLLLLATAGCDLNDLAGPDTEAVSRIDSSIRLPVAPNWIDRRSGEGSCVWSTLLSLSRLQGHPHEEFRRQSGGETPTTLAAQLQREGVLFAMTSMESDEAFLHWAIANHRGVGVTAFAANHMLLLVRLDADHATLIDTNQPDEALTLPREQFLAEWRASESWAVTLTETR